MKKNIVLLFVLLSEILNAQDLITKKNGEVVLTRIISIDSTSATYKLYHLQEGPDIVMPLSEIDKITYEEHKQEEGGISSLPVKPFKLSPLDSVNYYRMGYSDASKNYKGYQGSCTGVFIVSLLSPLVGLIPSIACASTSPKEHNLGYIPAELSLVPEYNLGYKTKAKKIKQGKVWTSWGVGLAVNISLFLILTSRE